MSEKLVEIFSTYGVYFALGLLASGPMVGLFIKRFIDTYLVFYVALVAFLIMAAYTVFAVELHLTQQNLFVALFGLLVGFSFLWIFISQLKEN